MAVFKCKMCGGDLEINDGASVAECQYCGTMQTLPKIDDEQRANLYDRANHFRRNNEYDKAMSIYERILDLDKTDAEAYWSLVLCKYGVEYVDDSASHKKVPTINRAQYTSIYSDENYKQAIANADISQKIVYEAEAKAIDEIQKGILEISNKEEPFDVFICYKETDEMGRRSHDSVYAQDLYNNLTNEGYKVFFSRITLEDKLGTAYEPYIFAALNSAKVMVVLGTSANNFNAVWVKNEWSRYLALIKKGEDKTLIPVYKDIDPYDLPEEFAYLQAQDMGKVGFMQDLVRSIKKLISQDVIDERQKKGTSSVIVDTMTRRGAEALANNDWETASRCYDSILDYDSQNVQAFLGKLMAEYRVNKKENLKDCKEPFDNNSNYQKAIHFGSDELKTELNSYIDIINNRNKKVKQKNKKVEIIAVTAIAVIIVFLFALVKVIIPNANYNKAIKSMNSANYTEAIDILTELGDYKNSGDMLNESYYCYAKSLLESGNYDEATSLFSDISDYKDSKDQLNNVYSEATKHYYAQNDFLKATYYYRFYNGNNIDGIDTQKINDCNYLISSNAAHTVGLKMDGTVFAVGYNVAGRCDVSDWKDIVAIESSVSTTVGLKKNGTVVAVGDNEYGQCNVSSWKDIVAVSAGLFYTVGLKKDGTVVAVGDNTSGQCNVSSWKDIVAVSVGENHIVGLKKDGTVVAVGYNIRGCCDVSDWRDIVAISAGFDYTIGLKKDGTVVAVGDNDYRQCDVSSWQDVVAVSAGLFHTVGLKKDGTVVAVGDNTSGQCNVLSWKNIVAVSVGGNHTVGLKKDGTVVIVGDNDYGQCDVSDWNYYG